MPIERPEGFSRIIRGAGDENGPQPIITEHGLRQPSVPEGFERKGGVLMPSEKPSPEFVQPGAEELASQMQKEERVRAAAEKERIARLREKWQQNGLSGNAFLLPDRWNLMDLVSGAIAKEFDGLGGRANGKTLKAVFDAFNSGSGVAGLSRMQAPFTRDEAERYFAAFNEIYDAFGAELRVSSEAQRAFLLLEYFAAKSARDAENAVAPQWSPSLIEGALARVEELKRDDKSYPIAKGILFMHAEQLGEAEKARLRQVLVEKRDTWSDLGFIAWAREDGSLPEDVSKTGDDLATYFAETPAHELLSKSSRATSRAFMEAPRYPEIDTKKGFEIEAYIDRIDDATDLEGEFKHLPLFTGEASMDGSWRTFEIRTGDGGRRLTPALLRDLFRLGILVARDKDLLAVSSAHVNTDRMGIADDASFLFFRKYEEERLEMQAIGAPHPRKDAPYLQEMSMIIDQTLVVDALYTLGREEAEAYALKKFEYVTAQGALERTDLQKWNAELIIETLQAKGRSDVVPAAVRLYARDALPSTALANALVERLAAAEPPVLRRGGSELYMVLDRPDVRDKAREAFCRSMRLTNRDFIELAKREEFAADGSSRLLELVQLQSFPLDDDLIKLLSLEGDYAEKAQYSVAYATERFNADGMDYIIATDLPDALKIALMYRCDAQAFSEPMLAFVKRIAEEDLLTEALTRSIPHMSFSALRPILEPPLIDRPEIAANLMRRITDTRMTKGLRAFIDRYRTDPNLQEEDAAEVVEAAEKTLEQNKLRRRG